MTAPKLSQLAAIKQVAMQVSQQIAKGVCHHTNISDMETLRMLVEGAIHEGAGHWMNAFAEASKKLATVTAQRDEWKAAADDQERALIRLSNSGSNLDQLMSLVDLDKAWKVLKAARELDPEPATAEAVES